MRPSIGKSVRRHRLPVLTAPRRFGEAGLYQSARRAVNLFFCSPSFFRSTRRRRSPPPISFPVQRIAPFQRGRFFTSTPARRQPLFFAPPKFFQQQAEKITSALLPVDLTNTSSHQRGAVSTSAPPRRQPLFSRPPKLSSPTPPRSRCRPPRPQPPDHSVRRGGRFLRPSPPLVKPFFTDSSFFSKRRKSRIFAVQSESCARA